MADQCWWCFGFGQKGARAAGEGKNKDATAARREIKKRMGTQEKESEVVGHN